jgi:isopenicillin-N N-acyltransferase-like protein
MTALPVIDVAGNAAQRGESYGRQAAGLIALAVEHYRRDFAAKGVDWAEAGVIARRFRAQIDAFDGELAEELSAIASGAGVPVEDILLLNARTEVLFWREQEKGRKSAQETEPEGCTSALAMPQTTRDGKLIHGQNWDWMPEVAGHTLALRIRRADCPDSLNLVEAGQLARHGFNELGVAVTAMGLHSAGDYGKVGIPSPLIRRRILSSANFGDALGQVLGHLPSFSHALVVSHADGEAFCFETTPEETFWAGPEDGLIAHANHFSNPAALARVKDANLARCPESLYRESRVRRALEAERGRIDATTFETCFADTFGRPNSILRPPRKGRAA